MGPAGDDAGDDGDAMTQGSDDAVVGDESLAIEDGGNSGSGDDAGPLASGDSGAASGCQISVCPTGPCMNGTTPCCKTMNGGCGCGGTALGVPYCI
jgi:hypothetical protein